ncbi:MAG: nitroreductase family protein [Thermoprotei archaeon]|nr:nitroreductase family protein [Thermoprotei archaeon]
MCESDFLKFLLTRRSIRKFKKKPVDLNLVLKILDVARYAPSAKNSQPWEFIVVTDEAVRERLSRIHMWASPIRKAPIAIVVVCDKDASPTSYHVDCANATMYIMLAAHALGLGTVWIQTLRNIDEIKEILKIPEGKIPIAILALGWPDEKPEPKPRKRLEEIVYMNTYGNKLLK